MLPASHLDSPSRAASSFDRIRTMPGVLRLVEIAPAAPGDEVAAAGFSLGWARAAAKDGLMLWAAPARFFAEHGDPCAEGLAQFGVDLERFVIVRARTQIDALWAAEQGLSIAGAFVLCAIAPAPKPLDLIVTRRLFLAAKKNESRCALIRLDTVRASAAEARFAVSPAPAESSVYGFGPPAFDVRLTRRRAGPAGEAWRLQWCAHEHAFKAIARPLDGDMAPLPADRPAAAPWSRAG